MSDAVADQRVGDCRERPDVAIAADRDARADDGTGRDPGSGADLGLASDDGARLDQNAVLETGRRVDRRRSGRGSHRLQRGGIEQRQSAREAVIGLLA